MHFLDDLHENILSGKDCPFSLDLRCHEHPDIHLGPLELQIIVDSFHSRLGQLQLESSSQKKEIQLSPLLSERLFIVKRRLDRVKNAD